MGATLSELVGIPLPSDADHKTEIPTEAGPHSRDGILDHNRALRLDPEQGCGHQERIGGRLPRQVMRVDHVAVDLHVKEVVELDGLQDRAAVLARGDDSDLEASISELP